MHKHSIVRKPGKNFAGGITTSELGKPDPVKALEQHAAYCYALRMCGLELTVLEADERYPDGCFVEDTAVITNDIAVITRPGAVSRRGEELLIEKVISGFRKTVRIEPPGTLDGGDIMKVEDHFYIGLSGRTDRDGASQLAGILSEHGFTSSMVEVGEGLHLKSGISYIGRGNILVSPPFRGMIPGCNEILLAEYESYSANSLYVNGNLLIASGFPLMKSRLESLGYSIIELEMSEFRKMDGGLTCLSLLFR